MRRPHTTHRLALVATLTLAGCSGGRAATTATTTGPAGADGTTTTAPPPAAAGLTVADAAFRLASPRSRLSCAVLGRAPVCFGGLNAARTSSADVFALSLADGSTTKRTPLAAPRHDAAGAALGRHLLMLGGGAKEAGSADVLDLAASPPTVVGHLAEARSDLNAVVTDGKVVVTGGYDGTTITPGVLVSDDGVAFHHVGDLVVPVRYGASAASGGTVFVFGGKTVERGTDSQTDAVQAIDLASGRTTVVAHLPKPLGHAVALSLGGAIWVLGGRTGTTTTADTAQVLRFDASTSTVTVVGHLPRALADSTGVVVDGVGFLIGGERSGRPVTDVQRAEVVA